MTVDDITAEVLDSALFVHRRLGPGLLEVVYESVLAKILGQRGLVVERQKAFTIQLDGLEFKNALRVDLFVQNAVVVELKSTEQLQPVHSKQLLTYLRLLELPVGLLINFGSATLKSGIRRVVNNYQPPPPIGPDSSASPRPPRLRVSSTR